MNCKFCNNFIPDDAKVCSICGKSVAEEALVAAETTAVANAAPTAAAAEKPAKVYKKKSLTLPLVIILIAAAAFVYMWVFDANGIASCTDYLKANSADSQQSATDVDDDLFNIGGAVEDTVNENNSEDSVSDSTVAVGANAAAGAVGLAGVALLGKRMSGNRKAKKQG